ncbi:MAG: hypothetical protein ACTHLK_22865, partial [Brucella intermedia]
AEQDEHGVDRQRPTFTSNLTKWYLQVGIFVGNRGEVVPAQDVLVPGSHARAGRPDSAGAGHDQNGHVFAAPVAMIAGTVDDLPERRSHGDLAQ